MRKSVYLALALAGILAAPAISSAPAPPHYLMTMAMYDGDRLVAEPQLELAAGEAAGIAVEPGNGSSYKATIVVNQATDGRLRMSGNFSVVSPTIGKVSANPELLLAAGEKGTVEFGYDGGGMKPFRAEVTFKPLSN
jgi:hypothetical protein